MADIPSWALLIAAGAVLLGWFEYRFVSREHCRSCHLIVDKQIEERKQSTHELRGALQPLMLEVGTLKADMRNLVSAVDRLTKEIGKRPCTGGACDDRR